MHVSTLNIMDIMDISKDTVSDKKLTYNILTIAMFEKVLIVFTS